MLREEEEERYQLETRISRLFWMSLARVPLWLSRQEVSWSAAPWTKCAGSEDLKGEKEERGLSSGKMECCGYETPAPCLRSAVSLSHPALLPHLTSCALPILFPACCSLCFLSLPSFCVMPPPVPEHTCLSRASEE